jgi:hypothetical protein
MHVTLEFATMNINHLSSCYHREDLLQLLPAFLRPLSKCTTCIAVPRHVPDM